MTAHHLSFRVFVSVGTDHHPFDRLMDWVENWVAADHSGAVVTVQRGSSRSPVGTRGSNLMSHEELLGHMRAADAVVLQGGPGGVIDSLRCGRRPIVVPRVARLGEHVDDHQVAFARHLGRRGSALLAESEPEFFAALNTVAADRTSLQVDPHPPTIPPETLDRLVTLVDALLNSAVPARRVLAR